MSKWEELKLAAERLKAGVQDAESFDEHQTLMTLYSMSFREQANPDAVLELIAENEEMAERMRLWSFMHGKKAEDLIDRNIYLQAEVRRLKIAAGEPVEPLPEEFVGPHRLSIGDRLRRKLLAKGGQDNG